MIFQYDLSKFKFPPATSLSCNLYTSFNSNLAIVSDNRGCYHDRYFGVKNIRAGIKDNPYYCNWSLHFSTICCHNKSI